MEPPERRPGRECSRAGLDKQSPAGTVVLIGSDIANMQSSDIDSAFARLGSVYEVVVGPVRDGGYWLIGMRDCHTNLFRDITWSSAAVVTQTLQRAEELALGVSLLVERHDIDEAADLKYLA